MKTFNLQRTFSILALSAITVISTISGYVLFRYLSEHLLQRDMIVSAEFIQSVAQINNPEPYFKGSNQISDRFEFEQFFRHITQIPDVLHATVYDTNQTIIWSDNSELIGKRFTDNVELDQALNGNIVFAREKLDKTEKTEHLFLPNHVTEFVENYLPIWNSEKSSVIGVVELYFMALYWITSQSNACPAGNSSWVAKHQLPAWTLDD